VSIHVVVIIYLFIIVKIGNVRIINLIILRLLLFLQLIDTSMCYDVYLPVSIKVIDFAVCRFYMTKK